MALSRIKNEYITSMEASKLFGDFLDSTVDGSNLTGIEGIDLPSRHNLALNYLSDNVRSNLDTLKIEQGWVDTFKDESDVDGYVTPSTGNASDYESKVNLTLFDGASDKLQKNDSGLTDSTKFTISFWFHPTASKDSSAFTIVSTTNARFQISRRNSGVLEATFRDSSGTTLWDWDTASTNFKSTDGLQHILIGMDLNNSIGKVYANGVEQSISSGETKTTGVVDITNSTFTIGNNTGGSDGMPASIGQFFVHNDYIDLSVQANRELFYKDGPVFLGANGENPFGTSAMIYLNNMYDGFQNNSGTGGSFGVTGELVYGGEIATGKGEFKYSVPDDNFTNSSEIIDSYGKENRGSFYEMSSNLATVVGQSINLASDTSISKFAVQLSKAGSPTGIATFWIGDATGTAGSTGDAAYTNDQLIGSIDVSTLTTSYVTHYFTPPEPIRRASGDMVVYVSYSGGGGADKLHVGMDASGAASGSNLFIQSGPQVTYDLTYYLYGQKNLDLITKGSDDIGNSPSTAPAKGHMEVLLTESPAGGTSIFARSAGTNSSNGTTNTTYRTVLRGSDLSVGGDKIRIQLSGPASESTKLDNVSIVERSSGANGTTTPTEVLFGGSSGIHVLKDGTVWSDWFNYTLNTSKDYLVCFDITSDSNYDTVHHTNAAYGGFYWQSNADSHNIQNMTSPSGFTANHMMILSGVQVETQQTLNTDIIAEMSRDGGTTYSPVTLSRKKTNISNINYNLLVGEADFNGDPSGTNIVGRVRTANKDKNTIHGISVNWISE